MRIGVIGVGNIGGTLGKLWAERGHHEVMFGVRDAQNPNVRALLASTKNQAKAGSVKETAAFSEAVLLAVPWASAHEVIQEMGDLRGKVLIDPTNRVTPPSPEDGPSAAEDIARWAAGARVVKAFNTLGAGNLTRLQFGSLQADTFICGDDAAAKSVVNSLARAIGFEVVDVGPLANAALVETLARLWVQLAYQLGLGPDIAFKLLKRDAEE